MLKVALVSGLMLFTPVALAIESSAKIETDNRIIDALTDTGDYYVGPTVEDQVALMDSDHNGFADVFEVRAYLELQHGKGYQKELLDKMVRSAERHSCGTSITNELTENTYLEK